MVSSILVSVLTLNAGILASPQKASPSLTATKKDQFSCPVSKEHTRAGRRH